MTAGLCAPIAQLVNDRILSVLTVLIDLSYVMPVDFHIEDPVEAINTAVEIDRVLPGLQVKLDLPFITLRRRKLAEGLEPAYAADAHLARRGAAQDPKRLPPHDNHALLADG